MDWLWKFPHDGCRYAAYLEKERWTKAFALLPAPTATASKAFFSPLQSFLIWAERLHDRHALAADDPDRRRHRLVREPKLEDRRRLYRDAAPDRLFRHVGRHDEDGFDDLRLHRAFDRHRHSDRHRHVALRPAAEHRQSGARRHADDAELRLSHPRRHAARHRPGTGPDRRRHLRHCRR